jgi:hypothetical protein
MALNDFMDGKMAVMAIAASLTGYVFYGHINLVAKVDTIDTKQVQVIGEQKDLWGKYNDEAMYKVKFMQEYYEGRLEDEKRWTDYWKEKSESNLR